MLTRVNVVLLCGLLTSSSAYSAVCHRTEMMEGILEHKFQQEMVVVGQVTSETTFRLYASSEDRSWTVVLFNADKTACVVVAGDHLDTIDRKPNISLSPEAIELFKSLLGEDA